MGIPIRLHFSWFVIFGLITWALATRYFPQVAPELSQSTNWIRGAVAALMLFLSVTIHELSHSIVARGYKIPISSITLFIFGGVAQMDKEPSSPKIEMNMALAGPFSSYVLALIFYVIYKSAGDLQGLKAIFLYLFQINLILATFNLIPGFPMDGGRVLRAVLWERSGDYLSATRKASRTGQFFGLFFIFLGLLSLFTGYMGSLWFLLIGWFLYTAAQASYQQATTKGFLADSRVKDVMVDDIITVSLDLPLTEVINSYFLRHGYGGFPVTDGQKIVGLISLKEIKGVPEDKWNSTRVEEVMQKFDDSLTVSEEDEVSSVFEKMVRENKGRLLVIRDGRLRGLITRSGIARYLQIKGELRK
jgi:Zn-dependent protease/CBS domain-containing protein